MNRYSLFLLIVVAVLTLVAELFIGLSPHMPDKPHYYRLVAYLGGLLALLIPLGSMLVNRSHRLLKKVNNKDKPEKEKRPPKGHASLSLLARYAAPLSRHYGLFWRYRVPIIMVSGEKSHLERYLPSLTQQGHLLKQHSLLLWHDADKEAPAVNKLRWYRPYTAMIHLSPYPVDSELPPKLQPLANAIDGRFAQHLEQFRQQQGWQIPSYYWLVSHNQQDADSAVVLYPLSSQQAHANQASLSALLDQLAQQGSQQLLQTPAQPYLLQLAQQLTLNGSEHLDASVQPFLQQRLPLVGLLFSQVQQSLTDQQWQALVSDVTRLPHQQQTQRAVRWPSQLVKISTISLLAIWLVGTLISYFANRALISQSYQQIDQLTQKTSGPLTRLHAQLTLQQILSQLREGQQHHVAWYYRFGLNQQTALYAKLLPYYQRYLLPMIQHDLANQLANALSQKVNLPVSKQNNKQLYPLLKAYLMLSQPQHLQLPFLQQMALAQWRAPEGISQQQWPTIAQSILTFWAEQLPDQANWLVVPQAALVGQARSLLINQLGQQQAQNTLYQQILRQAANHYPPINLTRLLADKANQHLFSTEQTIPGIFSRQAWQETIKPAIEQAVKQRHNEIDWVLSDNQQQPLNAAVAPSLLQQHLTERYLTDFANHWLKFLNSLQWQSTENLSDTIDQLTLLTDLHQSPLIALLNALNQQSLTGQDKDNLANSLIKSAKSLFTTNAAANKDNAPQATPLLTTFAPLLALMDSESPQQAVSLNSYLTRITRVRLKLQQIINSADPQAMAQQLAQSLFAGKTIDFADTQEYANLLTASLGQNLQSFGDALFIQPMKQAWQQLLTPASQSLNNQWQQSIVNDWQNTFAGRYPFTISQSDASLPLLAQFLQADSGKIDQFMQQHLAGLLSKQGGVWQVDQTSSQGLTFNPAFLDALNTLSHISQVAFNHGEARLYFELRPGSDEQVMQTILTLDQQTLSYDNQLPFWQRFVWPNDTLASGANLSWMSKRAGSRIYADYRDSWGWIRLLADAKVTPYAGQNNSYLLRWPTADGSQLSYILRTEYAEGPLVMLTLRHFVLPTRIFLSANDEDNDQ